MLEPITDLPDTAVGFIAKGKIVADDYRATVIPAVTDLIDRNDRANVLLVIGSDSDTSAGAKIQDAKLGLAKLTKWNRFALVSDQRSIHGVAHLFNLMVPGEVRSYPTTDIAEAKAWVGGDS